MTAANGVGRGMRRPDLRVALGVVWSPVSSSPFDILDERPRGQALAACAWLVLRVDGTPPRP